MTKLEYMQYVREKLQGYDREFVEEILENSATSKTCWETSRM